jgi:hypothetical protein
MFKLIAIVNFCEMPSLEIIILVATNFSSVTRRLGGSFDLTNLRFQLQDLSCKSNDLRMLVDFQHPIARCNQIGVIRTAPTISDCRATFSLSIVCVSDLWL